MPDDTQVTIATLNSFILDVMGAYVGQPVSIQGKDPTRTMIRRTVLAELARMPHFGLEIGGGESADLDFVFDEDPAQLAAGNLIYEFRPNTVAGWKFLQYDALNPSPQNEIGIDGTCKACGSLTKFASYSHAPKCVPDTSGDYYVWCTNKRCEHWIGEVVGDQECPPEWATHDKPEA